MGRAAMVRMRAQAENVRGPVVPRLPAHAEPGCNGMTAGTGTLASDIAVKAAGGTMSAENPAAARAQLPLLLTGHDLVLGLAVGRLRDDLINAVGGNMHERDDGGGHRHSEAEERRIREAGLDETIEASFPASDPASTDPNPEAQDDDEPLTGRDEEPRSGR